MTSVRQLKKETKNAKFIADMVFRQVHDQKIVDFFVYFEKNQKKFDEKWAKFEQI
ncbi:hypothetical protein LABF125_09160 [Lactobacillus amylovorus subsp. animalium]|uniref:Uncharacterized protein n=1 Tax=Lactobacillus amylovorus subsp. animalium TaxID=3378536 RepID=A0ABQ6P1M7_LACAM|nr:hypothetical protein LABF125_09160 [Lactobacillus amylovorus]